MIQIKLLKKSIKLLTIYSIASSCAGVSKPPKIEIGALLTNENQAKINYIKNYNDKTCALETVPRRIVPIVQNGKINPSLNGSVIIPYNDFIKFQEWAKIECRNYNENKRNINNDESNF